jgi:hypothetical protein
MAGQQRATSGENPSRTAKTQDAHGGQRPSRGKKQCPECDTITGTRTKACPNCGHNFPFKDKPANTLGPAETIELACKLADAVGGFDEAIKLLHLIRQKLRR